ncbi:short-chain fatty acid transporter [Alloalcanivorax sp. C16-1]|uniref:short-chain fatty acid transporter n=1 Tax=Alloalcanivorax sp. C16-1 TaxID=3390051 RepID=UPI003970DA0E
MLQAAGAICARVSRQFIPNPFIFAILLSAVVYLLGIVITHQSPAQMVGHWYDGFWNLLQFSMQMVVILLFGYVLASSPPVRRAVRRAAALPRSAGQAVMLVTVLAVVFGFLSWGLGLIVGAIAAREVCSQAKARGIKVHYPLAAAAGFSGLIIFNFGLSASAPLLVNTQDHFLIDQIGLIPVSETIFSPANLITFIAYLIIIPLIYRAMHPNPDDVQEVSDDEAEPEARSEARQEDGETTLAEKLENAAILNWMLVVPGLGYLVWHFYSNGFDLNLNLVNFALLVFGLIAYRTPMAYVNAIDDGIRACGQIVLQFPLYAGIMGMMAGSGLVTVFANWLVSISTPGTFPLLAMISAGVVNLMVPSAGGQWAVQGPLLIQAGQSLGVDNAVTVLAFGYGDQLTNAIQPMWMLPLLGVTALKARDVVGYTAVMMLFAFAIFGLGITVLPPLFG